MWALTRCRFDEHALDGQLLLTMKSRPFVAEFLGTALLIIAVVGSGIMGERLSAGNAAVALLANAIATGAALFVLIHIFGPVSGAHFNPVVSTYMRLKGKLTNSDWAGFIVCQTIGAVVGVVITHYIFALPLLQVSRHARDGMPQVISEAIATFGLLLTICAFERSRSDLTPSGVALYITGAYWFTSSTSFANPSVTIARMFTNTFAGIAPQSVPGFIVGEVLGLIVFTVFWRYFSVVEGNI